MSLFNQTFSYWDTENAYIYVRSLCLNLTRKIYKQKVYTC